MQALDTVTSAMALEEELFLGLRQLCGIDLARIETEYHVNFDASVAQLAASGLVEEQSGLLRLPPEKLSVSNEIIVELLRSLYVTV